MNAHLADATVAAQLSDFPILAYHIKHEDRGPLSSGDPASAWVSVYSSCVLERTHRVMLGDLDVPEFFAQGILAGAECSRYDEMWTVGPFKGQPIRTEHWVPEANRAASEIGQ